MASISEIISATQEGGGVADVLFWLHGLSEALLRGERGEEEGDDVLPVLEFLADTLERAVTLSPHDAEGDWAVADERMLAEIRHLCLRCLHSCFDLFEAAHGAGHLHQAITTAIMHATTCVDSLEDARDIVAVVVVLTKGGSSAVATTGCLAACCNLWGLLEHDNKTTILGLLFNSVMECNHQAAVAALAPAMAFLHNEILTAAVNKLSPHSDMHIPASGDGGVADISERCKHLPSLRWSPEEVEVVDSALRIYAQFVSQVASSASQAIVAYRSRVQESDAPVGAAAQLERTLSKSRAAAPSAKAKAPRRASGQGHSTATTKPDTESSPPQPSREAGKTETLMEALAADSHIAAGRPATARRSTSMGSRNALWPLQALHFRLEEGCLKTFIMLLAAHSMSLRLADGEPQPSIGNKLLLSTRSLRGLLRTMSRILLVSPMMLRCEQAKKNPTEAEKRPGDDGDATIPIVRSHLTEAEKVLFVDYLMQALVSCLSLYADSAVVSHLHEVPTALRSDSRSGDDRPYAVIEDTLLLLRIMRDTAVV